MQNSEADWDWSDKVVCITKYATQIVFFFKSRPLK